MYGVSKLCESTYSRILAKELQPRHIMVSACCPGYVATDMSSHRGYKTTAQGADTPTWLALVVPPSQTGKWSTNSVINDEGRILDSRLNAGLIPTPLTRDLKWGIPVPVEGEDELGMAGKVLCMEASLCFRSNR